MDVQLVEEIDKRRLKEDLTRSAYISRIIRDKFALKQIAEREKSINEL